MTAKDAIIGIEKFYGAKKEEFEVMQQYITTASERLSNSKEEKETLKKFADLTADIMDSLTQQEV